MKIYNILVQDRHCDPEIESHANKEMAIAKARDIAKKSCRSEENYEEHDFKGCLFYANYSFESGNVTVIETELIN